MSSTTEKTRPSFVEFVVIISLMMSITALSIDAMLPALPYIGSDLGVQNANDRQLVVSVIFVGIAFGQLFFGPLSDATGRKTAIYVGYAMFVFGIVSSPDFFQRLSNSIVQIRSGIVNVVQVRHIEF